MNLERAIEHFEAALRVRTQDIYPGDWARSQTNLGGACAALHTGDRTANLRRAIDCYQAALRVFREDATPTEWAGALHNLAAALVELPDGQTTRNIGRAVECCTQALRVATKEAAPLLWARIQATMGGAFEEIPGVDRISLLRKAASHYRDALSVFSKTEFPVQWANTTVDLAGVLCRMPSTEDTADLLRAVELYDSAAAILSEKAHPVEFARIQHNLGVALLSVAEADDARDSAEAIPAFQSAIRVFTKHEYPMVWAATQMNAGIAWKNRSTGSRDVNLRQAVECHEAALTVYTRSAFPDDWARVQCNLGAALSAFPDGGIGRRAGRVVECYKNALQVFTPETCPDERRRVLHALAQVFYDSCGSTRTLAAIQNPDGTLPFADWEVEEAAKYFRPECRVLLHGPAADRRAVLNVRRPDDLLLCCHGSFSLKSTEDSALILADGAVSLSEIVGMDLRGTALAVMSACETGLTDVRDSADEYIGLAAAFLSAGVSTVISTLWAIDDVPTALLMREFRCNLHERQMSPPRALVAAQRWLKDLSFEDASRILSERQRALAARGDGHAAAGVAKARFDLVEMGASPFQNPVYWAAFQFVGASGTAGSARECKCGRN